MNTHASSITVLGETTFRRQFKRFGIADHDLRSHVYLIGKTGVVKSTLLRSMLMQQIARGRGCGLIDPHGDLAASIRNVAQTRNDVVYLDVPGRGDWRFNPLSGVPESKRPLAAAGVVDTFKKLWKSDWGPRLEHVLRNAVFTLLSLPGGHLGHLSRLLVDESFRNKAVEHVTDAEVRRFWLSEFARYSQSARLQVASPILNKVAAFLTDPRIRRVLSSTESTVNLRRVIDAGQVLIVNLSKGELGEGPSALLGSLLVSSLSLAALSRAELEFGRRRDFVLFLDEFQTFSTLAHATLLAEVRKYGFAVVLAHQYLSQLDAGVRDAVLGNVGTLVAFRVGGQDAAALVRELPVGLILRDLIPKDLVKLPNYNFFVRLLIDGEPSKAFSGRTVR